MNHMISAAIGGVAAVALTTSAIVFANRDEAAQGATRTVCTQERVVTEKEWGGNGVAGAVVGGAAGGVLGHQIGGGHGKDAATAAGAVGGAYLGKKYANEKHPDEEVSYREHCEEVPAS
jgi:uncharacterized protein YcfJ